MMFVYYYVIIPFHPQYLPRHAPLILQGAGCQRAGCWWLRIGIFTLLLIPPTTPTISKRTHAIPSSSHTTITNTALKCSIQLFWNPFTLMMAVFKLEKIEFNYWNTYLRYRRGDQQRMTMILMGQSVSCIVYIHQPIYKKNIHINSLDTNDIISLNIIWESQTLSATTKLSLNETFWLHTLT